MALRRLKDLAQIALGLAAGGHHFEETAAILRIGVGARVRRIAPGRTVHDPPGQLGGVKIREKVLAGQLPGFDLVFRPLKTQTARQGPAGDVILRGETAVLLGLVFALTHQRVGEIDGLIGVDFVTQGRKGAEVEHLARGHLPVADGLARAAVYAGKFVATKIRKAIEPAVAVAQRSDKAQGRVLAEPHAPPRFYFTRVVGRHALLEQIPVVVKTRPQGGALGRLGGFEGCAAKRLNIERDSASAVVPAPVIQRSTAVKDTVAVGGFRVAPRGQLHVGKVVLGRASGADIDNPAGEIAGVLRRVGLLHQQAADNFVRHDIQRHGFLKRHRAGNARAVEQSRRIALTETAHIDVLAVDQTQTGHPRQGDPHAGLTEPGQILHVQHIGNLRGVALFVGDKFPEHENFLDLRGRHLGRIELRPNRPGAKQRGEERGQGERPRPVA